MIPSGYQVVAPTSDELEARYLAYRRRHVRSLVGLIPQEAIRPLYRRALDVMGSPPGSIHDPLSVLLDYCDTIFPLPPYEAWVEDALGHPAAHLADLDHSAGAPTAAAPATIETLRFGMVHDTWVARLRAFRDRDTWRGFITFEDSKSGQVHRTTLIFREPGPAELRERFLAFETRTLEAFLRSALP